MKCFHRNLPYCGHCGHPMMQSNFERMEKTLDKGYFVIECLNKACEYMGEQQRMVIENLELIPHTPPESTQITLL